MAKLYVVYKETLENKGVEVDLNSDDYNTIAAIPCAMCGGGLDSSPGRKSVSREVMGDAVVNADNVIPACATCRLIRKVNKCSPEIVAAIANFIASLKSNN